LLNKRERPLRKLQQQIRKERPRTKETMGNDGRETERQQAEPGTGSERTAQQHKRNDAERTCTNSSSSAHRSTPAPLCAK
jgi:hypothetical protein